LAGCGIVRGCAAQRRPLPDRVPPAARRRHLSLGVEPRRLPARPAGRTALRARRGLVAAIRAGETYRAEIVNRHRDGSTYPADLLISPVRDAAGSVTHFVVVQRDITDRKRADDALRHFSAELEHRVAERTAQLESANRELESFSYSVSHDLRAPLRAVDGFSRMLEDDYADHLDAEGIRLLQRIRGGAHRMGELIDDLLRLSRLQRGQLHHGRIDLSALVRASAAELRCAAPQRAVELVIADGVVVEGDRQLLTVALHNLLDNAWKYTSKRATARIEFGTTAGEDGPVYFVRDDGAGFDMRYVGKLFGAFQRLHGVEEFEGTGIGLASVQRIIARRGGRVWAEAAVDGGATFFFTLPPAPRVGAGRPRRPRVGRNDTATGAG
jgi:signal transduction histidine kinase